MREDFQEAAERFPERKKLTEDEEEDRRDKVDMRMRDIARTKGASPDFGPPTLAERTGLSTPDEGQDVARKRLEHFLISRDPSDEVDVDHDGEKVKMRLEGLGELKKEHQKKAEAGDAESAKEVQVIETAEKHLKSELVQISRAEEYNTALETFSEMKKGDAENLEAIAETGRDKHGNEVKLFDRNHNPLKLNGREVRELAGLAHKGVHNVTWEQLSELFQMADTIIHEMFISTAKRMLGWRN